MHIRRHIRQDGFMIKHHNHEKLVALLIYSYSITSDASRITKYNFFYRDKRCKARVCRL